MKDISHLIFQALFKEQVSNLYLHSEHCPLYSGHVVHLIRLAELAHKEGDHVINSCFSIFGITGKQILCKLTYQIPPMVGLEEFLPDSKVEMGISTSVHMKMFSLQIYTYTEMSPTLSVA